MEQTIKAGDFVRLTDPADNGSIVRVESVDEYGFASWLGGSQKGDMEQIKANVQIGDCSYYLSLSSIIGTIEQGFEADGFNIKLYPESAVNYWKHRAEIAEQSNALNDKLLKEEHNKLLAEQEENDELSNHIFVLDGKLEKLELDNHSLDQVAKVFQSDLAKKDAEIKELRERNEALKRQLDESNKQIEIYAKKVRNLEADLEEGGFNDERNFI